MIVSDLIKASIRLIGTHGPTETPPPEDIEDGLQALNMMLDSWFTERAMVYAAIKENFSLVAGTNTYTVGSSGAFNTVRPFRIESAYIRDSNNNDTILEILSDMARYDSIATKTTQGKPYILFYDPQMSLGKVYLYYTPNEACTLSWSAWKPVTQVATSATALTFPPGYERALKYNLAVEMAPEYGRSVTPEVAVIAQESKRVIKNLNISTPDMQLDVPGQYPRVWDINAG